MEVYIAGKRVRVSPKHAIGKGGEADIYDLGQGIALKLYKAPEHPDYAAFPEQQVAAAQRLACVQTKLPAFPTLLPERVLAPLALATDRRETRILGYTMPLLQGAEVLWRYGEKAFRRQGIDAATVVSIFYDLHETVAALHAEGIIIGDFNDLNVLVRDTHAYVIDADSFQFGTFPCQVYTEHFVDPLLCDPRAHRPILQCPYTHTSDWYAYTVMLFRSLLLLHPYGGVYKPTRPSPHLAHAARPLHRITVFDPEVRYPRAAHRYDMLPDELLHYFHQVFTRDMRGVFPLALLQALTWTSCSQCGFEHARRDCPACRGMAPSLVHSTALVRGEVTVELVVNAPGPILCATADEGKLRLLICTDQGCVREDQQLVFAGPVHPHLHFRLLSKATLIGQRNQLAIVPRGAAATCMEVETYNGTPMFDSNGSTYFWVQQGQLLRAGAFGPERIGDVLSGQTQFWVGRSMGCGFYRAGELCVAFVFDPTGSGINDSVRLPAMGGHIVEVTCQLAQDRAWLLWRTKDNERTLQHAAVIRADGNVEATVQTEEGTAPWLRSAAGALAVGAILLVPTDDGITRVEIQQGHIIPTRTFPDTEPFVDASSRLLAGSGGIYVVRHRTVHLLKMR
jgi:H/ACA ribonucleoprotein complex subunit 3